MKSAAKKLIPASALAMSLVVFTSCRIESIIPDLEPYMKEITGSDSTSFMTALTAASSANSANTADFTKGFTSGYEAGFAEAAKRYIGKNVSINDSKVKTSAPSVGYTQTVSTTSSDKIPSWGYTSNSYSTAAPTSAPAPAVKKSTSSYKKSSSSSRSYSSRRRCSGGS